MKLQYLGDARDAFKWDLLHSLCSSSPFSHLVVVPLLTPDDPDSSDGAIPHDRFESRQHLWPFLESLGEAPRSLQRVVALGGINAKSPFDVLVHAPERFITRVARNSYWQGLEVGALKNAIVFFDPDNGFETTAARRRGNGDKPEWICHAELADTLSRLPESSVAIVYQHRPRRRWNDLFNDLAQDLDYCHTAVTVYNSDLAFVALAGNEQAGKAISAAMLDYVIAHSGVGFMRLVPREAGAEVAASSAPEPGESTPARSTADRLLELKRLLELELVTPEEYTAKREEILKDL